MSYTTYYERRQKIAKHEAEQLEHLLEKQAMPEQRNLVTRRLRFENMIEKTPQGRYSICMLNFDPEQIYLEFKHLQRGITYKKISRISKEDCLRILEGDVDWMADSKDKLYQEFCRQVQLNCIRQGNVVETCKTVYQWKADYICLKRSIRSIRSNGYSFLDPDVYMISCLDCSEVELTQKKAVTLPRYIESVMHGNEVEQQDGVAFVL